MNDRYASDDTSTDPPGSKSEHRVLALVLALVAIGCLVVAGTSKRWLFNPVTITGHEVGFGLRETFVCLAGEEAPSSCVELTNDELLLTWRGQLSAAQQAAAARPTAPAGIGMPDDLATMRERQLEVAELEAQFQSSAAFVPLGWITLVASGVAALALVIAAALVLARKRVVLPIMPTTLSLLALFVGLICGCVFLATKPGPPGYVGVGYAFIVFGVGVIAGLASSLLLNKLLRPGDPDLLSDAMNPDQY